MKLKFLKNDILYGKLRPNLNKVWLASFSGICSTDFILLRAKNETVVPKLYSFILRDAKFNSEVLKGVKGAQLPRISFDYLSSLQIPLPPLSIQQEIVAEIEGYQKIIDGARQVVENYKPKIKVEEGWEVVELDDICSKITDGSHYSPPTNDKGYPYITVKDVQDDKIDFDNCRFIDEVNYLKLVKDGCRPENNDVLFSKDGTVGKVSLVDFDKEFAVLSSLAIIRPNLNIIIPKFLKYILKDENILNQAIGLKTGSALKRIILVNIKKINIPLPPLDVQKEIVARIEEEQKLVDANKKLIELFEGKIKEKIAEVWG
jgi:restriction endonuclease S subunit